MNYAIYYLPYIIVAVIIWVAVVVIFMWAREDDPVTAVGIGLMFGVIWPLVIVIVVPGFIIWGIAKLIFWFIQRMSKS